MGGFGNWTGRNGRSFTREKRAETREKHLSALEEKIAEALRDLPKGGFLLLTSSPNCDKYQFVLSVFEDSRIKFSVTSAGNARFKAHPQAAERVDPWRTKQ
jgi:hypothetical protein